MIDFGARCDAAAKNVAVARLADGGWEVGRVDDGSTLRLSQLEMRALVRRVREVWAAEYRALMAAEEAS